MQFSVPLILTTLLASLSAAEIVTVSYDTGYDDPTRSMLVVSCSDGNYGLANKYPTQGNIPTRNIGGAFTIGAYNSPNCGKCYQLTYGANSVYVLAIDHAAAGFNVAKAALDSLTNGQAEQLGRINADYTEVAQDKCIPAQ